MTMKRGKQRGVAAVELGLIIGPLLIATFGITELGRALYQYNALVKASREAVRYLALQDLANLSAAEKDAVYSKTKSLAVCGAEVCTNATPALAPGLSTAQVSLCDYLTCVATHKGVLTGEGTVDLVTVTIGGTGDKAFNFTSLVPFVIPNIAFSPIKTTMASRYF
jgi:Flp pilus assembly protein TadG